MQAKFANLTVLAVLLICRISPCLAAESSDPNDSSKYLDAVREFADNVLKYGRDTYGKPTPLFVDGLNIHTHEPVKWIDPDGTKWILSNFASQQNLMRTLDGLSSITGDVKYRQGAKDAIRYAFDHLRAPSGLFYWGHITAYDALGDTPRGKTSNESIKMHYPYYELMWEVDPDATNKLIEALWCAHVIDWSNLDFNRLARIDQRLEEPWRHEYDEEGPTFFRSKSAPRGFFLTATSLIQAGTTLYRLSHQEQPLVWSKRLAKRFVDTRHPKTGISAFLYNGPWLQLGEDLKEHFVDPHTTVFPYEFYNFRYLYYPEKCQIHPWMSMFLVGDVLGEDGREFTQWALEELIAWGEASYREKDNSFVPILTDGTNLEGYVWKEAPGAGPDGFVVKPCPADMVFFWGYSVAYRVTGDEFVWEMVRDIARGNDFGEVGQTPEGTPKLRTDTTCSHVYALLGFLELYAKTKKLTYLEMARRIGDNILLNQLHKGFFVPSKRHIYTRFNCFEPLALLHLDAAIKSKIGSVPSVWPDIALFVPPYRYKEKGVDLWDIYALTESSEPPLSLQEAAAIGDLELVRSLLDKGVGVDSWDDPAGKTALHRAAISGHKDVVELLLIEGAYIDAGKFRSGTALYFVVENGHKEIAELLIDKGADINAKKASGDIPLHYAARAGHKDIVELLIAKGADVNAKNNDGQTPVDIAINRNHKDIVELLVEKGAVLSSIHDAARMGVLTGVKAFLEQGVDVNAQDDKGFTPLHYTVQEDNRELTEFLIAKGANVNAKTEKGLSPLTFAARRGNKDIIRILVAKGADVNLTPENDYPPLDYAVWNEDKEMVELFVNNGAKFDVKDRDGWTAFRYAASQGNRELVEFFVGKGADTSSLHMAACVGDLARVKNFVEQGTNVDAKDELGWTPLCWAASTGRKEVAEFLIANGAYINVKTRINKTPLHRAAQGGKCKLAELLISRGAEVDAKDRGGHTPLYNAASAGHREVVELLIAKGANVDEKNYRGQTPLYRAVEKGRKDVVEVLIDKGAEIDSKVKSGQTPLHYTAIEGRKDMAALLIAKGADVNSSDVNGETPLHLSARQGHSEVTKLLVSKGADMNVRNRWNRTPLDIAIDRGHNEIAELLRKHTRIHNVAFTNISRLYNCIKGDVISVEISVENRGGFVESFVVELADLTDGRKIESKNVVLSVKERCASDADVTFTGEPKTESRLGLRVLLDKDINGDGYGDMFIGAPRYKEIQGKVYIYYGRPNASFDAPDLILTGEDENNYFGHDIEAADFNNDGYTDMAITALGYNSFQGRVYIYYGGPGFDTTADKIIDGEPGTTGRFGRRMAAGDINNDGCAELLVCADQLNDNRGRVYLYYGAPGTDMDTTCDLTFDGENPNDLFGKAALALGKDVDGDGYGDVLIGTRVYPKGANDGRVYLYWGAEGTSMNNVCDLIFNNQSAGEQYAAIDVFDINNDGFADIIIGAQGYDRYRGRVYVHWGAERTSMDTIPDRYLTGEHVGDLFGAEGIICGYVNNDNYGDILIPAVTYNDRRRGRAYLFYGNTKSEMDVICDMIFTGESTNDAFPTDIAVGDINCDNFTDVFIGACLYRNQSYYLGRAYLHYGGFYSSSTDITFTWDTTNASPGKHTLRATIAPVEGEEDRADNTMTVEVEINEPSK